MTSAGRARPLVLAHTRFLARKAELEGLSQQELFTQIWRTNLWGADTSASGLGSEDAATAALRQKLPKLFRQLKIETLLDLPCGDFGWMSRAELGLRQYTGADIVAELVDANRRSFATADGTISFVHLDLLTDACLRPMRSSAGIASCISLSATSRARSRNSGAAARAS
jgi:hypothetical protein